MTNDEFEGRIDAKRGKDPRPHMSDHYYQGYANEINGSAALAGIEMAGLTAKQIKEIANGDNNDN